MAKLLFLIYFFQAARLFFAVLRRAQDGELPPAFEGRKGRYLARGTAASLLWPLALFSPKSRRMLY